MYGWHPWCRASFAGLLSLATLVACTGGDEAAPTATPEPTAVSTPVPTIASDAIGEILWTGSVADDGEPADTLSVLDADADGVYAVLPVTELPAGTTVRAVWSINGQPVDALNESITLREDVAEGWIAFDLTWSTPERWPIGTLAIEITTHGDAVASAEIDIVEPDEE